MEFQKKKKHFKIIFILTTIALILLLNKILFYSQSSTFTKTQTDPISIISTDESKELFRKNMFPKTYIYHINIQNRNQIPEILKRAEIPFEATHYFNDRPSYNQYSRSYLYWYLKEPPNGLIHAFFTPRQNPFHDQYPTGEFKYTIQDLLQHDIAFEEAWLFYDVSTQPIRTDCKIHNIDLNINLNNHTIGQEIKNKLKTETKLTELELTNYRDQIVRQEINKYLLSNKIIKSELKEIMPNHMNVAPNYSISFPFNQNDTTKTNFCLYFDDGFRAFNSDTTIDTLLKLSNDAKNGYLFNVKINLDYSTYQTLNSIEQLLPTNYLTNRDTIKINLTNLQKQNYYINETLSPSYNPKQTIVNYVIDNYSTDPNTIGTLSLRNGGFQWQHSESFETYNNHYNIGCDLRIKPNPPNSPKPNNGGDILIPDPKPNNGGTIYIPEPGDNNNQKYITRILPPSYNPTQEIYNYVTKHLSFKPNSEGRFYTWNDGYCWQFVKNIPLYANDQLYLGNNEIEIYTICCDQKIKHDITLPPSSEPKQTIVNYVKNNHSIVPNTIGTFSPWNNGYKWTYTTVDNKYEYDIKCNHILKYPPEISYYDDGTIQYITEYNENGNQTKFTKYNHDGTINFITEYDRNENLTKSTDYTKDSTIWSITEYNPKTNQSIKKIFYYDDGTIDSIHDPKHESELQNWKNQCFIKRGNTYSANKIRDMFGKSSRTIYDEYGNTHSYYYDEGFFVDNWEIDGKGCGGTYYQYLDISRPPTIDKSYLNTLREQSIVLHKSTIESHKFFFNQNL